MRIRMSILAVLAPLALLTACGSNDVVRTRVDVTIGERLIDLKKARDSGALTAREYEQQRARLIDSVR